MLNAHNIIAFVPTTNAQLAREFYEQKLGLKFVSDDGFALVFEANQNMLRVVKLKEFTPAQFTILGWEVSGRTAGRLRIAIPRRAVRTLPMGAAGRVRNLERPGRR